MTSRDSNGTGRGLVGQEQPQPRSLAGSPGPDPEAKNGVRSTPAPGPSGAQHSIRVPAPSVAIGGRRERKMVCDSYSRREGGDRGGAQWASEMPRNPAQNSK